MMPDLYFSRMKWQSTSLCFVLSCWIGLATVESATLLSHSNRVGPVWKMLRSLRNCISHKTSQVVRAIARYSTSTELLAIRTCFLDFQDIVELPSKMQKHVVDFLDIGHPAQSLSQYATSFASYEDARRIPWEELLLRYLRTLWQPTCS